LTARLKREAAPQERGAATRVRAAPSPTGYFHVGNARTCLFNWLFARQQGGSFILRIEDTDAERNRPEWVEGILGGLAWLGMEPDEGPYFQSQRSERYQEAIEALWGAGFLYACDCTRDEIDKRTSTNATPGYDGFCRDRGLDRGEGRALRFRTPDGGSTIVRDLVRGDVSFPNEHLEDFVCVKSSGLPLFVLANVVDDRDMAISHVIRGDDLLPTTPKGILLWDALNTTLVGSSGSEIALPAFAHLPMLVNEQGKKLSKRRDPVSVEEYREAGYLPQAFRNYLALLGWSPPGQDEKVDLDVLVSAFRLEAVHHAPAFFDVKKLTHMNGEYIREMKVQEFVAASMAWVHPEELEQGDWHPLVGPPWPPERFDIAVFEKIAPLAQERVAVLGEVPPMVDFLFLAEPPLDESSWQKVESDPEARAVMEGAAAAYATCAWEAVAIKEETLGLGERFGRKLAKVQMPIRVAVTGRTVGPPLFESLELLGRAEVLRRLAVAIDRLEVG